MNWEAETGVKECSSLLPPGRMASPYHDLSKGAEPRNQMPIAEHDGHLERKRISAGQTHGALTKSTTALHDFYSLLRYLCNR